MVDRGFETELERAFGEAPALADADGFAARVTARLDQSWSYRQALIGGLGIAGGLIGGAQFLGSGLVTQLAAGAAQTNELIGRLAVVRGSAMSAVQALTDAVMAGPTLDARILLMSVALAAVAGGLFLTRASREI